MTKFQWLVANIALTAVLTLLPPSLGSIRDIVENALISINLVEWTTKFVDNKNQS
jgi:hypothetical protein